MVSLFLVIFPGLHTSKLSVPKLDNSLPSFFLIFIAILLLYLFFKLYFFFVLHHLSYCSSVWDPPLNSCNYALLNEKTQFFAFKMCSHKWNVSYTTLLSLFGIPSLSLFVILILNSFSLKHSCSCELICSIYRLSLDSKTTMHSVINSTCNYSIS